MNEPCPLALAFASSMQAQWCLSMMGSYPSPVLSVSRTVCSGGGAKVPEEEEV